MTGNNRYELAKKALIEHDGEVLSLEELKSVVMKKLASKESVVTEYLKLMDKTQLIKEKEQGKFDINAK